MLVESNIVHTFKYSKKICNTLTIMGNSQISTDDPQTRINKPPKKTKLRWRVYDKQIYLYGDDTPYLLVDDEEEEISDDEEGARRSRSGNTNWGSRFSGCENRLPSNMSIHCR